MSITNKVFEVLSEISGINLILDESKLRDDLGFDSLDMVTLLINIEEKFGFQLDESDMNPFDLEKASDVITLVEKYSHNICYEEENDDE